MVALPMDFAILNAIIKLVYGMVEIEWENVQN